MSESERTPGKRNRSHVPPTAPRASSTRTVLPGRSRDNRHPAPTPASPAPTTSTSTRSSTPNSDIPTILRCFDGAGGSLGVDHVGGRVVMRIAVIGAGGVGGWLAARLGSAGADVHVVARGAHLAAIQAHGLTLTSPMGDVRADVAATDDAASIGPCDAVLLCVKAYDTASAAALLPGLCHDTTV